MIDPHLILGFSFLTLSFLWLGVSLYRSSFNKNAGVYGGVTIVIGIALISNNSFVYGISIFIVATLITEIEFLEKLAALVWGRKEYWDYKIKVGNATKNEVENKLENEAKELYLISNEHSESKFTGQKNILESIQDFELKALNALSSSSSPLPAGHFEKHKTVIKKGIKKVIDAVLSTEDVDYVIEIKYSNDRSHLMRAIAQISYIKEIYKEHLSMNNIFKEVSALIVVPSTLEVESELGGIALVKINPDSGEILNAPAVIEVLSHS